MLKKAVKSLNLIFLKIFAFGAGVCMFGVFGIILVNSSRRYIFGKSFEWGEQLPVFLAVYGIMFGISWAYMKDQHIKFTVLVNLLPKKFIKPLYIIVDFCMIITGIIFSYSGYLFASKRGFMEASGLINSATYLQESSGIDALIILGKMYPYQMSLALGGAMLAIASFLRVMGRFYGFEKLGD